MSDDMMMEDGREESAAILQAMASADELPGSSGSGAAAAVVDPAEEARQVVSFCVSLFAPVYPSLKKVYTDDVVSRLAGASVHLMQKYGLSFGGIFERWGAEINFALVAVPLVQATAEAVRHDRAAALEDAERAADGSKKPENADVA